MTLINPWAEWNEKAGDKITTEYWRCNDCKNKYSSECFIVGHKPIIESKRPIVEVKHTGAWVLPPVIEEGD